MRFFRLPARREFQSKSRARMEVTPRESAQQRSRRTFQ